MADVDAAASAGMDPQVAQGAGVVARSGLPTVELKQPGWGVPLAPQLQDSGAQSRRSAEQRALPNVQELRTATREELQQRMESLKETYDHLMTVDDNEEDAAREEAELVLQRLQQTQQILSTVSMSARLDEARASGMDALIAPLGPGEPPRDGDPMGSLDEFMRTQPMARNLNNTDMVKLRALMRKEQAGSLAVEQMTRELQDLKAGVQETETELSGLVTDLHSIKEVVVQQHGTLRHLQLNSEKLNSELRELTMKFEGFDAGRARATGFDWKPSGIHHHFTSPKGPVLLVSAKPATTGILRWKLRVLGNASWALGVVPEECVDQPDYLFTDATVGLNSSGTARACKLPRHSMHETWIEAFVDLDKCTAQFGPWDLSAMPIVQHFDPALKGSRGLRLAVSTFIEVEVEMVFS